MFTQVVSYGSFTDVKGLATLIDGVTKADVTEAPSKMSSGPVALAASGPAALPTASSVAGLLK